MDEIRIDRQWADIAEKIKNNPAIKTVYLIGCCDTGKSTLAHYLVMAMSASFMTGYLDCDPGQSVLGTPATLGLGIYNQNADDRSFNIKKPAAKYLSFVGSHTPVGHLLENMCSIKKLQEKAYSIGARKVIIDSCGYTEGAVAHSFQFFSIDITAPDLIIEMHRECSLKTLLLNFSRTSESIVLPVSTSAGIKSPGYRKTNREERIRQYFSGAKPVTLSFNNLGMHGRLPDFQRNETYTDLLVALCNRNNFVIVLGIVMTIDITARQITLLAPPFPQERVTSFHFGSLYCRLSGEHRYRFKSEQRG